MVMQLCLIFFLFASYAGWGWLYFKKSPRADFNYGIKVSLGCAIMLFYASILALLGRLAPFNIVLIFYLIGFILFLTYTITDLQNIKNYLSNLQFKYIAIYVSLICFIFITGYYDDYYNIADDFLAYLPQIKKWLDTNNLIEPFSMRRLSSYGAQSILQASFFVFDPLKTHMFEKVFVTILLLPIAYLFLAPLKNKLLIHGTLFGASLVFIPRINIAPQMSGFVFVLAFIWLLKVALEAPVNKWSYIVSTGLLASAVGALRANYVASLFVFYFLSFFFFLVSEQKEKAKFIIYSFIFYILFLIPWAIQLYISSNTFYFPIFSGNLNVGYNTFNNEFIISKVLTMLKDIFIYSHFVLFLPIIIFSIFNFKKSQLLLALILAAIIPSEYMAITFTNLASPADAYRYQHAFIMPAYFLAIVNLLSYQFKNRKFFKLLLFVCLFEIHKSGLWVSESYFRIKELVTNIKTSQYSQDLDAFKQEYASVLSKVKSPTTNILVSVERPFLLDFAKYNLFLLDIPGNATINHTPLDWYNAPQTTDYFNQLGIHYILHANTLKSDLSLFREPFWAGKESRNKIEKEGYHLSWEKQFLGYFYYLAKLKKHTLYSSNRVHLVEVKH